LTKQDSFDGGESLGFPNQDSQECDLGMIYDLKTAQRLNSMKVHEIDSESLKSSSDEDLDNSSEESTVDSNGNSYVGEMDKKG